MINRLQTLIATWKAANPTGKTFLFTASPQCAVKDPNMGDIILGAKFDMIFVQFYNNPVCSAKAWAVANPNFASTRKEIESGFSYDSWVTAITASGSKSTNAKIYIGLPGNGTAATSATYYLAGSVKPLIQSYWCHKNFGGIMIWEAIYAEYNKDGNFYQSAKSILNGFATGTSSINCATVTTTKISATPTCGAGSCATKYTVKSGDSCSAIATTYKLTMAQFTALNPTLTTTTCPKVLQPGQVVCVKAGAACKKRRDGPAEVEALLTPLPKRHAHSHVHAHAHAHRHIS
jgi:chitinase